MRIESPIAETARRIVFGIASFKSVATGMEKSSEYTDQEKNGDWAPPSVQPEKHQRPTLLQQ